MVKSYDLREARSNAWNTWQSIPLGGSSCPRGRYSDSYRRNTEFVRYIEDAIKRKDSTSSLQWHDLLCAAYFGKGLSQGLLEMKEKTYKNRTRSLKEIESITHDFNIVCIDLASEPDLPQNHLRLGRGYGSLGLAKEGKNMLEEGIRWDKDNNLLVIEPYWTRISTYLSNRIENP